MAHLSPTCLFVCSIFENGIKETSNFVCFLFVFLVKAYSPSQQLFKHVGT